MITKIYLVRHTQTIGNAEVRLTGRTDFELTDKGKEYVNLLTKKLENVKFDAVYSSTSGRSVKTVLPLSKLNNLKVIENEDLCEMYLGIYDGMKWEDVNKINPEIDRMHEETNEIMGIPEQETTEEVAERVYKCIRDICQENLGKTILVASHGVAIEAFLRKVTKVPFKEKREEYSQKNTSINIVEYDSEKDKFDVKVLNDISHLK